jgi:hypothetical protein
MEIFEVATSTVAASMFSTLNVNGPMLFDHLLQTMRLQGFDCERAAAEDAARALINRKLITADATGALTSRYPANWVMALRNREDPSGWQGWTMKNLATGEHKLLADLKPER